MLEERVRKLAHQQQAHNLDYAALLPGPSLIYLTGLDMILVERPIVALFPAEGRPTFILPNFEAGRIDPAWGAEVFSYTDEEGHEGAFQRACSNLAGKRIGVEYLGMRALELRLLGQYAPGCRIEDLEPIMAALRMTKDETEIEKMRGAARITAQALEQIKNIIRPGLTELELAAQLKIALLQAGGEGFAFEPLVQGGPNSALPHGATSTRPFEPGDVIIVDWGAIYRGYCADMTRTLALGAIDPRLEEAYQAVQEANRAGREAVRAGLPAQEVDRAARKVIVEAGFGEYFIHRTGHGLGLEVHEPPYIVEGNEMALRPGMTFTVEPGIYFPDLGGVRIEDNVAVTADGSETLTTFTRELIRIEV
jgi:Xaa-Pro dipeptidase